MVTEQKGARFSLEISGLIDDLNGPDYITDAYSDIGVNSLIILRSVFRVDNSYLGSYLARTISANKGLVKGKDILDLGCGCGLLGLVCALNGARKVHFSDINPVAVKNSRLNSILWEIGHASFSAGGLFENIPTRRRFDLIVFNPPSIEGIPLNSSEAAFIREDRVIQDFFRLFPNYLKKVGAVIIPGASRFNSDTSPINMVRRYNLPHKIIAKENEAGGDYKYVVFFSQEK